MLEACTWRPSEITRCDPTALVLLDNDLPPACPWTETKETPALVSGISLGHSAQFEFSICLTLLMMRTHHHNHPKDLGAELRADWKWKCSLFSPNWLFTTLWTVAHKTPLPKEFSKWAYWSGLPFPSPGDLSNPGIKPRSPALQADFSPSEPPGIGNPNQKSWHLAWVTQNTHNNESMHPSKHWKVYSAWSIIS